MGRAEPLPFRAPVPVYEQEADALFDALRRGDEAAEWRFKWEHPRFRGKHVGDVRVAALELRDAQTVIAHEHGFETWADLVAFTEAVKAVGPIARFESAVDAVIAGDVATLSTMLREDPELIRARSTRRHHATLLHYVAANGVEGARQKTPKNAVDVAKLLLDAGAEADALADMYEAKCTTMSMLVSSAHPHEAGLQGALAETLMDYGAAPEGRGTKWQSPILTALVFSYPDTAKTLVMRGAPVDTLPAAAGLGLEADSKRLLVGADEASRHMALALAAQHGHAEIVRLLLDAGEDPSRYNPDGAHSHSTPLHQAVWAGHEDVVRLLVERGARLDVQDTVHHGTPLGWAEYGGRTALAQYLRSKAAENR